MNGHFDEDEKVYSQYQLAEMYTINPATAAKGLNLLFHEKILYKKRGLGMFVSAGAKERIIAKRKNQTFDRLVKELVLEAAQLQINEQTLIQILREEMKRGSER
ncbi:GntR family transcriptional regulator [Bacillus carboniphilus]|uniref:GntR family transcriptional regulator n=1 Tax=Bacillus carboniphilus TaxID=86663 RepID=UPI003531C0AA